MNRVVRYSLLAFASLLAMSSDAVALQPQAGSDDPLNLRQEYPSAVETSTITVTHTTTACMCGTGSLSTKSTLTSTMAGTTTKTSTTRVVQTIYYTPSSLSSAADNGGLTTGCPVSPSHSISASPEGNITCTHSGTSYSNFTLPLTTTFSCPTGTSAVAPIATTTHGTVHGSSSTGNNGYSSTYSSSPTHIPVPTGGGAIEDVSGWMLVASFVLAVMSLA